MNELLMRLLGFTDPYTPNPLPPGPIPILNNQRAVPEPRARPMPPERPELNALPPGYNQRMGLPIAPSGYPMPPTPVPDVTGIPQMPPGFNLPPGFDWEALLQKINLQRPMPSTMPPGSEIPPRKLQPVPPIGQMPPGQLAGSNKPM